MKRRSPKDPVSAGVRDEVLRLDGYRCVARTIDPTVDECRTTFGWPMQDELDRTRYKVSALELDHVRDEPMMGKRAPSDIRHLVALCPHHHRDGWATSHRPELREYLRTHRP